MISGWKQNKDILYYSLPGL